MKPVRSSTGSVGSSKIRKRPLSVVDPARQLQFVVGRPVEDEFEQPLPPAPWTAGGGPAGQAGYGADSMGQRAAIPPISVASNSMSVDSFHHGQLPPRPSAMAVPVPSGSKSVDVDEFDADDDDLLLAPESLMMLEQVEQKYSQMFPVAEANNGNSNPMPVRTVDALQQEFDSLPDIPEDGALAGILDGDGLSPDPQARPEKAASEVPVAATPANTNETGFQNQLAQLQAKLNEIVEQKRKLEQDMALKDGEVGMLRRKYGRLEEDLAKVREDLSDKDATIAQVRKEERTKHTKEVEALQTQIRFLEQEQQQAKRSALISSQMPVGFDGHHGLAPSQALRMTPSKAKNVSFARPAAQSPARQRSAPSAEDFGMPGIPQAKPPARDGTSANAKSPVIGNSAQGSQSKQLPGRSLLPPGDKLRLARFSREARAAEDRRNRFISDLFSDPVIAPQNRNNGSSGSASSSSASLFSISVALQPHPSIKVTKDALTGLDLALKGLNAQLMAVVAKKSLPLTSILTPLDSFLDSATELGAIKLVLFSVRLIKMLVKADEGCRKAILESRITTAVGGSDAQSMDLDEEEPRSRTLEHLCILLRHAAFSISPSQHGILTWLTEGPTRELRTDIVSILLSLAWGQSGPSLAKLGLIFDSGWHRHLCMKEQPLGSVKSFVQLCEHLLRATTIFDAIIATSNESTQMQTGYDEDSRTPPLEMGFLDQLANFFIEQFPTDPPPNYRLDSLDLRCALVRFLSLIAATEFPRGVEALLRSLRTLFWVIKSLSLEMMDCIESRTPSPKLSARFICDVTRLLHLLAIRRLEGLRRTLVFPTRQAHDLLVVSMGRVANGMLLDVVPELRDVEHLARETLELVAADVELYEIDTVWGGTKARQIREEEEAAAQRKGSS